MKKIIQYLAVCLCLFLCLGAIYSGQAGGLLSVLGVQTGEGDQQAFVEYLDQLFREEITANTINLHYTLKNPKQYGIKEYPISLGQISQENSIAAVAILENMQAALAEFDPDQMDGEYAMIHDMLKDEIQTEISAAQLYLYQEPLRPSTGVAGELPVLLAEYTFYGERDIQDYLALLRQLPDYYAQVLELEQKKADAGLFMPEYAAREIIDQCENFVKDKENNYLLDTFVDKVQSLEVDREAYIQQNEAAVTEAVIPAYELLIAGMEEILKGLEGQEWNQQGLYHLPQGREYYEYLVKSYTGSGMTVEEMQQAAKVRRAYDMSEAAKLIREDPKLLTVSTSYSFALQDPVAILEQLQEKMSADFPAPPDTSYSIKYVHPSLEAHLAPAFYLAVPIDDISQNAIYINGSSNYQKMKLYTTLAHEGFPGHLYQNIMERSQDFLPIRSLLGTSGYSEGWATYVEMISYGYAELQPGLGKLLMHDQSALLSLYATADLGIHGEGWSLEDMMAFFGEYQITDQQVLRDIYQLIVEEPAHYLKYYIGYLEFLSLKEEAQKKWGEEYSDYRFHEALMELGPAQFEILRKYFPD
ncbi:MAG: DUF885 domain-containing protein [Lachnospiraceae bacterium]|nr:DUF885 domain-containing protein [Lachnospiraceae bacterium]